jgi:CRP/FNR family transcriptional regulator, cyclic AMP receptor protein
MSHDNVTHAGNLPHIGRPSVLIEQLFTDPELRARQVSFAAGSHLCEEDQPATEVFFVLKGQVRLQQVSGDAALLLEILGPGQWFGVTSVAGRGHFSARAVAQVPSVVLVASAHAFMRMATASPALSEALLRDLSERMASAYDEIGRLVFDDCNARLVKTLLRFSETAAATKRDAADGGGVVLRITHQQLAQAVGVARETVSLALTQLRKRNMLKTGRNQLFFDPAALRSFESGKKSERV